MSNELATSTPWTPRQAAVATLAVVAVAACFGLVIWFRGTICLLFLAILLATALKPALAALQRRGAGPVSSVLTAYGALTTIGIGAVVSGLPLLVQQALDFAGLVPQRYAVARSWLEDSSNPILRRVGELLPMDIQAFAPARQGDEETALATVFNVSWWTTRGLVVTVAVLLLAIYWSLYEQRTQRALAMLAKPQRRADLLKLFARMEAKLGAYIRGQGILCLTIFVVSFAAFYFIGLPAPLLLALIAGVCEAVPMVGGAIGAIPALLVAASLGPDKVLWTLGAAVAIQQTENHLLVPRVMDRTVGINPVTTLLAMAAFGKLLGPAGVVLAIPLAAIGQILLEQYVFSPEVIVPTQANGRDRSSRLRYELQQLVRDVRAAARRQPEQTAASAEDGPPIDEAIEEAARDLEQALPPPVPAAEAAPLASPAKDAP